MDEWHKRTIEVRILTSIIARTGIKAMEQRLSEMPQNLSHLQFGILHNLADESQTISELSKRFFLDPSTLVSSVDGLEKKGFLTRERDPVDRRRVPLSITEEGRKILSCVPVMTDDDALLKALEMIDEKQIDQLLKLLRKVVHQMPEGPDMLAQVMRRMNFNKTESE